MAAKKRKVKKSEAVEQSESLFDSDFRNYMDRNHPGWDKPFGPSSFGISDLHRVWVIQGLRMHEKLNPALKKVVIVDKG